MNFFLKESLDYAQERCYLDDLFSVYPTINNKIRDIDSKKWDAVEQAYERKDKEALMHALLKLPLFPLKDSYVAFLKEDKDAIKRNPKTVSRIASDILKMSGRELREKCSKPKESNRQQGPAFMNFLKREDFGIAKMTVDEFAQTETDGILIGGNTEMLAFAKERLFYNHPKCPDFIGRMNGRYILGEAKFLTDNGGHQNAQFEDAIAVLDSNASAIKVAILDGVLYLPSKKKMYLDITGRHSESNIFSALLLKDFLYSVR